MSGLRHFYVNFYWTIIVTDNQCLFVDSDEKFWQKLKLFAS